MKELQISKETVTKLLSHRCQAPSTELVENYYEYHNYRLLEQIAWRSTVTALRKIASVINDEMVFAQHVFMVDVNNLNAIESALQSGKTETIEYLLSLKAVKARYANQDSLNLFWRTVYWLFVTPDISEETVDFVMKTLQISKETLHKLLPYQCSAPTGKFAEDCWDYHNYHLLSKITQKNTVGALQKMVSFIDDEKVFAEHVFIPDLRNVNVIERAIAMQKEETIQYVLSIKAVKIRYLAQDAIDLVWRTVFWLFGTRNISEETMDFVLKELEISGEKLAGLLSHKCKVPQTKLADDAWQYHRYSVLGRAVQQNSTSVLRKLAVMIGETAFVEHIFNADALDMNGIEYCIAVQDLEMMEYMLSFEGIKEKCITDKDVLFRVVYWLYRANDEAMSHYVVAALGLDEVKLKELQKHQCVQPKEGEFAADACVYWNEAISDEMVQEILWHKD